MSKKLTPLQALEEIKDELEIYDCNEENNWEEYPTGYYRCEEELNIIETALKSYEKLKECYKNELKNSAYYNNLALKYKKALEIIHEYFIFESEYGGVYFRANKEIPDDKYELLKEILL